MTSVRPAFEPDVTVVIVHRNRPVLLRDCIDALVGAAGDAALEVVVVDDCSAPARRPDLRARRGLTLVFNETQTSFAVSANQGADLARGAALLFLDLGLRLAPGSIPVLLDVLRDGAVAAVGPAVVRDDGSVRPTAMRFLTALNQTLGLLGWSGRRRVVISEPAASLVDVDWIERGALLVRTEAFRALCGFDEGYAACEDEDWCWRARQRGDRNALAPVARALESRAAAAARARASFSPELTEGQLRFLGRRRRFGSALVYRCGMSFALLLDAAAARLSRVRGKAGERRPTGALVRSLWRQPSVTQAGGTEARS
jgi:N-acetylglucosaminyl-diphospho-decaprenol L-rhamnosyltransferase